MEILLRILQDLVMLVLASVGIGAGVITAFGDVDALRRPVVRLLATLLFLAAGIWIFYTGIRHIVAG